MTAMRGVFRDERSVAVEHASYRLAYVFMSFALLIDVAFRSFAWREAPWELLGIVVLGGVVSTVYQWRHKILTRQSVVVAVLTAGAAALIAFFIAMFRVLG